MYQIVFIAMYTHVHTYVCVHGCHGDYIQPGPCCCDFKQVT